MSSIGGDMKNPIIPCFFDFTLKKNHLQVSDVMKMINDAKGEFESTLCHTDEIREEECVPMAHNTIIISSKSSSSDDSLETSFVESTIAGRRQITTKTVM